MTAPASEQPSVELDTPVCEKGIGKVIVAPDSKDWIAGVRAQPYPVWPDDRGYFFEVARMGQGLTEAFPQESTQVSSALSYPGTIKAFHFHRKQTDCWVPVQGMLQVALVDLRPQSTYLRRAQYDLCRLAEALAVIDPAGCGTRLQSDWDRACAAGLPHRPLL